MSDSIDADLDAARERLRSATKSRLAAMGEYNSAETALYDLWQQTYGSERYKADCYSADQRAIKQEEGADW